MLWSCIVGEIEGQFLGRTDEAAVVRDDDVVLVHLPLFHIYGMNVLMNGAIGSGATQVMMGRFDMELFLGLQAKHRVTMLFTVLRASCASSVVVTGPEARRPRQLTQ